MPDVSDTYDYARGRQDLSAAAGNHRYDALKAARAWKHAQNEHTETSYWGLAHVRGMAGYWYGVLRTQRERDWGWTTFHYGLEREPRA